MTKCYDETDETGHTTKFNWNDLESLRETLVSLIMAEYKKSMVGGPAVTVTAVDPGLFEYTLNDLITERIEEGIKQFFQSDLEETEGCLHNYEMSRHCGVQVCNACGDHKGLARCYCGWNLKPGEVLEDDVPY